MLVLIDYFTALSGVENRELVLSSIGLHLIFYGVYFGVVGRDLSELCSEKMAQTIGVGHKGIYRFHSDSP